MKPKDKMVEQLPQNARDYIALVIRKMGYRRKIRLDVQRELEAHFADALQNITDENEKSNTAEKLIAVFGDPKLLATLLRRGKKRCRPLWAKSLIRFAQAVGVFFIVFILYSIWFMTGKPAIRVDYIQRWNQMNQSQIQPQDSAWPEYEKAIKLYIEPEETIAEMVSDMDKSAISNFSAFSQEDQTKILGWLQKNESAWQAYVSASQKPYCWPKYYFEPNSAPVDQWLFSIILPHMGELRKLSKMGIWQAQREVNHGNLKSAFDNCMAVIRTGRHCQGKPTLIEQLVGLSISNLGHATIIRLSGHSSVTPQMLSFIQNHLFKLYHPQYPWMTLEGEKIMFLDAVQHTFTSGGIGGGHILPNYIKEIGYWGSDEISLTALCFIHAWREETVDKAIEMYDWAQKIIQCSPYQKKMQNISFDSSLKNISHYRYMLIRTRVPAFDRAGDLAFQGKMLHDAALTILALKRWKLDMGDYPRILSELVHGGYLGKEPDDPYAAGPLRYEKRSDDFILYSVGQDFTDDGGKENPPGRTEWGSDRQNGGGDRVFWPCGK